MVDLSLLPLCVGEPQRPLDRPERHVRAGGDRFGHGGLEGAAAGALGRPGGGLAFGFSRRSQRVRAPADRAEPLFDGAHLEPGVHLGASRRCRAVGSACLVPWPRPPREPSQSPSARLHSRPRGRTPRRSAPRCLPAGSCSSPPNGLPPRSPRQPPGLVLRRARRPGERPEPPGDLRRGGVDLGHRGLRLGETACLALSSYSIASAELDARPAAPRPQPRQARQPPAAPPPAARAGSARSPTRPGPSAPRADHRPPSRRPRHGSASTSSSPVARSGATSTPASSRPRAAASSPGAFTRSTAG